MQIIQTLQLFNAIIIHAEVNSAEYQEHNKISSEPDPVSTKFIQVKNKPAQTIASHVYNTICFSKITNFISTNI